MTVYTKRGFLQAMGTGVAALASSRLAGAQEAPIKIGTSMALSGPLAGGGRQSQLALQMWAEDINSRGGLLGRKVEIVGYDDPPRFTILSVRPDGPNWDVQKLWDARFGLNNAQYQDNVDALHTWMQPTAAIAYQDGGNTRYAVTWAQEKDPKVDKFWPEAIHLVGKDILRSELLRSLTALSNDEIQSFSFLLTNQIIKFYSLQTHHIPINWSYNKTHTR